jgi:hypothetical protein
MMDREKVIKGLEWCMNEKHDCDREKGCPYENEGEDIECKYALHRDALALLKTLDVTPEELERLKKCRHECKIDCLLEHYDKIKAERDALLKAQEPMVHGRWVKMMGMMPPEYHGHYECSECQWHMKGLRNSWTREEEMTYCPTCGAKMDGERRDEA